MSYHTLYDLIHRLTNNSPVFSAEDREPLSHADLAILADETRNEMESHGVLNGMRIAICLPDAEMASAITIVAASGAIACPLVYKQTPEELARYLSSFAIDVLLTTDKTPDTSKVITAAKQANIPILFTNNTQNKAGWFELIHTVGTLPKKDVPLSRPQADDVAVLLPTSGTTSDPKIVPITHAALIMNAQMVTDKMQLKPQDRLLAYTPVTHSYGLTCNLVTSLYAESSLYFTKGFCAGKNLATLIECEKITTLFLVPAMFRAIAKHTHEHPDAFNHIQNLGSAGSQLTGEVLTSIQSVFPNARLAALLGSTEALIMAMDVLPTERINALKTATDSAGYIGQIPLASPAGTEIKIINPETGLTAADGECGELRIKGPSVFSGYLPSTSHPNPNEGVFTEDGFFRTGDLVAARSDGCVYYVSRLKEMIKVSDSQVAPAEVEQELLKNETIKRAAAFGVPHKTKGQTVGVVLELDVGVLKTLAGSEEQREAFRKTMEAELASLSHNKWPTVYVLTDTLPTVGTLQKISRSRMAEMLGVEEYSRGVIIKSDNPEISVTAAGNETKSLQPKSKRGVV